MAAIATIAVAPSAYSQEPADSLGSTYGELDELIITAKKEVIKSDGAKLTYDMEQDDSSKGQSLLEALRKIPMVSVDGQDNVYIKGSSNFKIYVNGKEDPMLSANYKQVFKSMPAETVSKIEVITEPGAKYDAEGTGGILNLVTERKQSKDGYTGSIDLSTGSRQTAAALYGRVKYNKVTADANLTYANNTWQKQHSLAKQDVYNSASDTDYHQQITNDQRSGFDYVGANLNLSWEPSERDLFTVGADMNWVGADVDRFNISNEMFSRSGELTWKTSQQLSGSMHNAGASGNGSYRRLFDDEGQSLTAAYRFNYGRTVLDIDYLNTVESGDYFLFPYETNLNGNYQREHTATLDYVKPFTDSKHKLEAGAKGIFRRNSAETAHAVGEKPDELLPVADEDGTTRQVQDIYAAYLSYSGNYGKVAVTAGLRYEHTYMGLDFPAGNFQNFRRHLNDLTPNAAVTYMFGPATNLRLAYQMRINRPGVSQMNPTVFQLTQTMAKVGNPDLESERYNSVSLTYSNWGQKFGFNVSLSYGQADNSIESFNYYEGPVEYQSYANIGRFRRTELEAFLNWNITSAMTMSVNGGVNYVDLNAHSRGMHNSGWKGNYGANWSYRGPASIKYSVYGGQSFGNVNLQGSDKGWYYYGLAISKSFLKEDALTVSVNASNFFTKYSRYKSVSRYDTYTTYGLWQNRNWQLSASISWKFGKLQDRVKTTDANIMNNDTKQTSGGKGGGIGL